jgi:WD40 repeat protein/DNA-binding SARP family transcriptional activator
MSRLVVSLLGSFEVTLDGALITAFESAKVRALLAYLAAAADRLHRREALAALLWPDWPQHSAMSNLRYALADLRKNIGDREAHPPFLLITRESIQFNREAEVWVDVGEFEQGIKTRGEAIGDKGSATGDLQSTINGELYRRNLQSVIALYRGEFLEGFSLPDSPAFEQWVLARREDLHRQALQALFVLADAHEQQGNLEAALPYARRQMELEPWHEPGQQQLMRLLALSGQRSAALGQYEACRKALADELNVEPSVETKRLYEAIRDENMQGIRERGTGVTPAPYPLTPAVLPPAPGAPPFKGLQYFDVSDADLFFGREALTARLVGHIREMVDASVGASRSEIHGYSNDREGSPLQEGCCFLAVVGASGSGKSSVVRAGVVPALQRGDPLVDGTLPPEGSPGWHIHVFTPTAHPLEALAVSLTRESESVTAATTLVDDMSREDRSLSMYAQRLLAPQSPGLAGKCRLLLVVDQFEELFTLCRSETERAAFLDNLLTAVQGGGPTQVIVVLRADFYGHCAQYPLLRQALCSRQEYIGPMEASELRRAIELPAQQNGWDFEPGLVDLLLRDVGASEGHPPEPGALPLLEHALLETWKRRSGRTLTHQGYMDAGGVHGAIAKTAESVFTRLTPEQQALARRIFLRLTELGEGTQDTRRRAPLSELAPTSEDTLQVNNLLKELADARLITLSEDTAEVAHEALIREWPALRQWLSEDRDGLRLHRHLTDSAEAWVELERDPGELYRGARLAQGLEWAENHPDELNTLEREYLQASQAQAERDAEEREVQRQRELQAAQRLARTQRQRSLVLSVGLAIAVVLIGVALWLNSRANASLGQAVDARKTAQSEANNRSTQQALAEVQRSLALAAQATSQSESQARSTAQVEAEDQSLLSRSRELAAASVNNLTKDPQLSLLLALEAVNTQYTSEAESALHQSVQASHLEKILTSSPDATGSAGTAGSLGAATTFGAITHVAYSPDGKLLATTNDKGWLQVFDVEGGRLVYAQHLEDQLASVLDLKFSQDDRLAVEGDYKFVILEGASGRELMSATSYVTGTLVMDSVTNQEALWIARESPSQYSIRVEVSSQGFYLIDYDELQNTTISEISVWNLTTRQQALAVSWKRTAEQFHSPNVYAVSPDGTLFAIPYDYGVIEVRDLVSGSLEVKLSGMSPGAFSSVAFSPDGSLLAGVSQGNPVKVWEASSGKELLSLNGTQMFFSPDGQRLVVTDANRQVSVWSIAGRQSLYHFLCHPFQTASALRSDGQQLASAGLDGSVHLCAVAPDHETRVWVSDYVVKEVSYSPVQDLLGIANGDNVIRFYDARSGELRKSITFPATSQLEGFMIARNGSRFATYELSLSWDQDPEAIGGIWDTTTGQELVHTEVFWGFGDVMISPDGNRVMLMGINYVDNNWVFERESASLAWLPVQPYWKDNVVCGVAYSPDSTRLAMAKVDGRVGVFESPSTTLVMTTTIAGAPSAMSFNPDSSRLAIGTRQGTVLILDANSGEQKVQFTSQLAAVNALAYSPDGRLLASGNADGAVRLFDAESGKEKLQLLQYDSAVTFLAFSQDGNRLVSASADGVVQVSMIDLDEIIQLAQQRVRRTFTPEELQRYYIVSPAPIRQIPINPTLVKTPIVEETPTPAPTPQPPQPIPQPKSAITAANAIQVVELGRVQVGFVYWLAWAPGGKAIAVVSTTGLYLIDATTLQPIWHQNNASLMITVAFSPDGTLIATGGDDGRVRLWRATDGTDLASLKGHTKSVSVVAFSPDGSLLTSASPDDTVRLWQVPDWNLLDTLVNQPYAKGVTAMTFSPDGAWLATGSRDGKIRFWELKSRKVIREIQSTLWCIMSLDFSPDGVYLAYTSCFGAPSRILRAADGVEIMNLGLGLLSYIADFSPGGSLMAISDTDFLGTNWTTWEGGHIYYTGVHLWSTADNKLLATLDFIVDNYGLAFSPDGKLLAVGTASGYLILYGVP